MTCQEVTELMQRYLDKDLGELESKAMMLHLSNCLQCTAMFERMKHLSNELTLLPKVVPPYSLVDSIMPQLEELDHLNTAATPPTVIKQPSFAATWKDRMKKSASFKALGGVVAAGVIFAVVMLNGDPISFQNADRLLEKRAGNSAMNTGAADSSAAGSAQDGGGEMEIMASDEMHLEDQAASNEVTDKMESAPEEFSDEVPQALDQDPNQETMNSFGIQEPAASEEYPSPDGKYIAVVHQEGMQHRIIVSTPDQVEVYASPVEEVDAIMNLQWSEDSRFLEYDLVTGESVQHVKVEVIYP
jgi:hypothetical protein